MRLVASLLVLSLSVASPASAQTAAELQTRLALAWVEHEGMLVRYGSGHADVVALEAEIRSLAAALVSTAEAGRSEASVATLAGARTALAGELATARTRYGDRHPTVLELEARVHALDEALAALRAGRRFVPTVPDAAGG